MDAGVRSPQADVRTLALAVAAGVLAIHAGERLPSLWIFGLLSLLFLFPWRGRMVCLAAWLGLALATWQASERLQERWPASRHGQEIEIAGHVSSLVEPISGFGGAQDRSLRFEFAPIDDADLPTRIRVSWYRSSADVRGGECWTLRLKMRTPHGSLNPRAFDYEAWLYRRGVGALATVREAQRCQAYRAFPILRARQWLLDALDRHLGSHAGKPMIAALTVGDDSQFSDQDWDNFRQTGTSHLVAISGFNVAILAGLAFLIVRWTWPVLGNLALQLPSQKAGMIAAAITGLGYGVLAGWDSPAQRAALMLALLLLAALPDRQGQASRALAIALVLMLLIDPASVLSPGLWLSFGAVAAIFYASSHRLRAPAAWRMGIRIQLMLSVLLAPLTLYFFQGAAWLGIPVNLIAVPLMSLLTPLVVFATALAVLMPTGGSGLLICVADLLEVLQNGIAWIAANAPAAWFPASPPSSALLLAVFAAVLLFAPRGTPLRPLAFLCFLPLLLPPKVEVEGSFELTALDVGQGLSVLIRTRNHSLIYDAGPAFPGGFDAGESVVVPYVLSLGQRGVDRLLLSHGDRDHAGGVPSVRKRLRLGDEVGTDHHAPCIDGQNWFWDGVYFQILHPAEGSAGSDNNQSCVLRVSTPRFSVLLAGDIEREAETRLLSVHKSVLAADVLIAPHHGSKTSSGPAFVEAVSPSLAIFGAAWRSHFGHPRPEVVARYQARGAKPLVTGVEGAIRVWQEPDGLIKSASWRRQKARFWNAPAEP